MFLLLCAILIYFAASGEHAARRCRKGCGSPSGRNFVRVFSRHVKLCTWPLFNGISPLNDCRRARTAPTACWWRSARRRATSGSRATNAGNTLGHHTTSTIENIYLSLNCSISKLKLLNIKMLYSFMYSWVRPPCLES